MINNNVLCFGGGVDSTAILAMYLHRDKAAEFLNVSLQKLSDALPLLDCIIFSDTGAEMPHTYENVDVAMSLVKENSNIPFHVTRHATHTLPSWLEKNGNLPLLPGGKHVCSLKFKGQVMESFIRDKFGKDTPVTWLIGIEANEGKRCKRFNAPSAGQFSYSYPLVQLGIDRETACALLKYVGWPVEVRKSSCFFCPFMSEQEILDLQLYYPSLWEECRLIEFRYQNASKEKHQSWINAGKPVIQLKSGKTRAPKGYWQKDSYAEGGRLFAKSIKGRRLSIDEWTTRLKPLHPEISDRCG